VRLAGFSAESRPELLAPALCGRTARELLRARRLASDASGRLPRVPLRPPYPNHRFDSVVEVRRLALVTDCSASFAVRSCCSWVTPRHGLLRVQHLELRTACRLLRTRYPGVPFQPRIAPLPSRPAWLRTRITPLPLLGPPRRSTDCSVL